jgi:hypothetical protein
LNADFPFAPVILFQKDRTVSGGIKTITDKTRHPTDYAAMIQAKEKWLGYNIYRHKFYFLNKEEEQ